MMNLLFLIVLSPKVLICRASYTEAGRSVDLGWLSSFLLRFGHEMEALNSPGLAATTRIIGTEVEAFFPFTALAYYLWQIRVSVQ
jgi:hypothetical protein